LAPFLPGKAERRPEGADNNETVPTVFGVGSGDGAIGLGPSMTFIDV
jgi:hypothetical protein